jgi:superfamily II DNA or RNA helicase
MKNTRDQIQAEALKALEGLNNASAAITMGGGKTLIGLKHMDKHFSTDAKFLVVAPKKSIFTEWKTQAEKHGLEHLIPLIHFSTYLSLSKQTNDYNVVYLDECHSLTFSQDEWLSHFKGKVIGLTGTYPKHSYSEKGKMTAKYCPVVYRYETDDAIDDDILNDYKIIVHYLQLDQNKNIKVEHNGKSWYTSEKASYEYWTNRIESSNSPKQTQIMRVMRMKNMMTFRSKEILAGKLLNATDNKVLLFANTQEQADSFGIPSYHSTNPYSEENLLDFKDGLISRMSCVLQLSEGINIPNLKEAIILHAYGNERKASQRIGRCLRLNPSDTSTIHVLCYLDTIDETWVKQALENFDQNKITWV